jgi:citrate lyase subunit beta/citryl-CoA lyase
MMKAARSEADALILDLEDSVPEEEEQKRAALETVVAWLGENGDRVRQLICARVNVGRPDRLLVELDALVGAGIDVVMLPKVSTPSDVAEADRVLTYAEGRHGRPLGKTGVWPIPETVSGVRLAFEIAQSSARVCFMGAGIAAGGDMARELGCITTRGGLESLYVRSKVLLDVRAAGIHNPMTGVVADVKDPVVVEEFATASRQLGYEGLMVIHPSHIAPVNRVFSPSEEELADAAELLHTLREAEVAGRAAVTFRGQMVDIAMKRTAETLLDRHSGTTSTGALTNPGVT